MKSINLFGQEEHVFTNRRKSQKSIFDDYEGFVEKFNPKKTTDDCYTPPAVYDYVLQYVADHCDIDGMTVVRPFYPGGDYESLVYPDNCVVIDNPPFSIVSQIVRFYLKRGIKFFLFAPHLTLFSADLDCTRIVCGAAIVYENGAKVNTSFLSNMFGEAGVIGDPVLYEGIDAICSAPKAELPKYKYPDCVLTVSDVAYIVKNKGEIKIDKREWCITLRLTSKKAREIDLRIRFFNLVYRRRKSYRRKSCGEKRGYSMGVIRTRNADR